MKKNNNNYTVQRLFDTMTEELSQCKKKKRGWRAAEFECNQIEIVKIDPSDWHNAFSNPSLPLSLSQQHVSTLYLRVIIAKFHASCTSNHLVSHFPTPRIFYLMYYIAFAIRCNYEQVNNRCN